MTDSGTTLDSSLISLQRMMAFRSSEQTMAGEPLCWTVTDQALLWRHKHLKRYLAAESELGRPHPRLTREKDCLGHLLMHLTVRFHPGPEPSVRDLQDQLTAFERRTLAKAVKWWQRYEHSLGVTRRAQSGRAHGRRNAGSSKRAAHHSL